MLEDLADLKELYFNFEAHLFTVSDELEESHWCGGTFLNLEQAFELRESGFLTEAEERFFQIGRSLLELRDEYLDGYVEKSELSLVNLACHKLMLDAFHSWGCVFETEEFEVLDEQETLAEAEHACRLMATVEGVSLELLQEAA